MPDLGPYAGTVLAAWGATIVLLAALIGASLWQSYRVKRALALAEQSAISERMGRDG